MISVKKYIKYSLGATPNEKSLSRIWIAKIEKLVILRIFKQRLPCFPMASRKYPGAYRVLQQEIYKMMDMTELKELDKAVSFGFLE